MLQALWMLERALRLYARCAGWGQAVGWGGSGLRDPPFKGGLGGPALNRRAAFCEGLAPRAPLRRYAMQAVMNAALNLIRFSWANGGMARQIEDLRLGLTMAALPGTAGLSVGSRPSCLAGPRSGVLRYGDAPPMQAQPSVYRWREVEDRILSSILTMDGRDFHDFRAGGRSEAADPSMRRRMSYYGSRYDVCRLARSGRSVWRVTGPRKDLILSTEFSRERS